MVSVRLSLVYSRTLGLYLVYIERLFHIFDGNIYAFRATTKWICRTILISLTLAVTGFFILNRESVTKLADSGSCSLDIDTSSKNLRFGVLIDVCICYTITSMYCRKLLVLMSRLNTQFLNNQQQIAGVVNPHHVADKMYFGIMKRSTVLTFVASVSAQIFMALILTLGAPMIWTLCGSMVNTWCLVLIFDIYDDIFHLYNCCCCGCERLMCHECIVCCSCHYCCKVDDLASAAVGNVTPIQNTIGVTGHVHHNQGGGHPVQVAGGHTIIQMQPLPANNPSTVSI